MEQVLLDLAEAEFVRRAPEVSCETGKTAMIAAARRLPRTYLRRAPN